MHLLLLHHGCLIVGISFIEVVLSHITSGGTLYGASYVFGVGGDP